MNQEGSYDYFVMGAVNGALISSGICSMIDTWNYRPEIAVDRYGCAIVSFMGFQALGFGLFATGNWTLRGLHSNTKLLGFSVGIFGALVLVTKILRNTK